MIEVLTEIVRIGRRPVCYNSDETPIDNIVSKMLATDSS